MKRRNLSATEAAHLLFGEQIEHDDFKSTAPFRSGADVCQDLAEHFGLTAGELRRINKRLIRERQLRERRQERSS